MKQKHATEKDERELLSEINDKLEVLILLAAAQGDEATKVKALKKYKGYLSKREVERLTGVDRREL